MGTVITSDNAPAKIRLLQYGCGIMVNLRSIFCKINAKSHRLFVLLEPHSSFRFQYRLLTMTTFFEIAVYFFTFFPVGSELTKRQKYSESIENI